MGENDRSVMCVLSCGIPRIIGMLLGGAWGGILFSNHFKPKPSEENLRTLVNGFISAKTL